jgi:excisionase family DNA binding protein
MMKDSIEPKTQQLKLLTVPEAAKELRISNWLLYELIRKGQLKTLTIATRRLIASDDLANFINERKEQEYET